MSWLQGSRVAADRSNPAKPIRVGIVGANPARSRALAARLPALVQLSGFTVTAVSTTRQQSAEETAVGAENLCHQAIFMDHAPARSRRQTRK